MKRLDAEPTEEVLKESIQLNSTGRNADIVEFVKLLNETEGPFAYMLDAPWGDGKTFFLKSMELVLKSLNPQIVGNDYECPEIKSVTDEFKDEDVSMLPFYFNAWENDFAEDPVTTLFASMAAYFDREDLLKETSVRKGITSIIDAGLAAVQLPLRVSGVSEALTSESLVSAFAARSEIRTRIASLAETCKMEVANKLVVFIDELDRCRPDFAVRLLEETKNLFNSESIIIVFATDSSQLAKAVAGMYGSGFNTPKFLERFFDERVTMSPVDGYAFAGNGSLYNSGNRFDRLADELMHSRTFTMRDAYRIKRKLEAARKYVTEDRYKDMPHQVANCTVLPVLIFIEHDDIDKFRLITSGADFDAVYEYAKQFMTFNDTVKDAVTMLHRHMHGGEQVESTDADCRAYMHDLCIVVYGSETSHFEYYEAQKRIGSSSSARFNVDAYKRLVF